MYKFINFISLDRVKSYEKKKKKKEIEFKKSFLVSKDNLVWAQIFFK